jgi:hypothetical protein
MPAALLLVVSPILHPVAARAGEYLAWLPAEDVTVLRRRGAGWRVVRRLGHDNAGAIAGLLADGALTIAYARGAVPMPPGTPALPAGSQPQRRLLEVMR